MKFLLFFIIFLPTATLAESLWGRCQNAILITQAKISLLIAEDRTPRAAWPEIVPLRQRLKTLEKVCVPQSIKNRIQKEEDK